MLGLVLGADARHEERESGLAAGNHVLHRDVVRRDTRREEVKDCARGEKSQAVNGQTQGGQTGKGAPEKIVSR